MTKPQAATNEGPRIAERGMVRERLMPADAPNLCALPENRHEFEAVIESRYQAHKHPTAKRLTAAIGRAKAICAACPVREACLTVHGPDFELGVVAGFTDQERRDFFGQASA